MKRSFSFLLFYFCSLPLVFAQFVTHGPVVGALGPHSARMYVRTSFERNFILQLSQDTLFGKTIQFAGHTVADKDFTTILNLTGLQPYTFYYYRLLFDGQPDERKGSFTTFPPEGQKGHYVFTTGSCQETENMKVFDVIPLHQPNLFLHTGDWTYPSYQLDNTYPTNYNTVQLAWRRHYNENRMKDMLLTVPIDYVHDDDDGFGPHREAWYSTTYTQDSLSGEIYNGFTFDTITQQMRSNVFKAYTEFFPAYALPDTSIGLYHSFKMGNCEFFFLDTRSNSDLPTLAYQFDVATNLWSFNPPPGHKIIGTKQMQWLKNGLMNSNADWKFLVGGVPFNKNIRLIINFALNFQQTALSIAGVNGTGFRLSASFAGYWAGYPEEQNELLQFIADNQLKDLIYISGDTHHNVIDDGTNAGMPELNASGLSVTGTNLAYFLNLFGQLIPNAPSISDSVWNGGGNGLGNTNFKNAFGKIEVFNADSVKLYVIDEDNEVVSHITIAHSGKTNTPTANTANNILSKVYPVPPQSGQLIVQLQPDYTINPADRCYITDMAGKTVAQIPLESFTYNTAIIDVSHLPHGNYIVVYQSGNNQCESQKIYLP